MPIPFPFTGWKWDRYDADDAGVRECVVPGCASVRTHAIMEDAVAGRLWQRHNAGRNISAELNNSACVSQLICIFI
jgi:hypothetical protein